MAWMYCSRGDACGSLTCPMHRERNHGLWDKLKAEGEGERRSMTIKNAQEARNITECYEATGVEREVKAILMDVETAAGYGECSVRHRVGCDYLALRRRLQDLGFGIEMVAASQNTHYQVELVITW